MKTFFAEEMAALSLSAVVSTVSSAISDAVPVPALFQRLLQENIGSSVGKASAVAVSSVSFRSAVVRGGGGTIFSGRGALFSSLGVFFKTMGDLNLTEEHPSRKTRNNATAV
jgi:hypothetical protein